MGMGWDWFAGRYPKKPNRNTFILRGDKVLICPKSKTFPLYVADVPAGVAA
jgi:hypothetical protein